MDGSRYACTSCTSRASSNQSGARTMASLPREVDLPLFWSEQELQELQGTQLLTSVEGYRCRPPALARCTAESSPASSGLCQAANESQCSSSLQCSSASIPIGESPNALRHHPQRDSQAHRMPGVIKPRECCCRAFFEGRFAELDAELFSKHREAFPKDDLHPGQPSSGLWPLSGLASTPLWMGSMWPWYHWPTWCACCCPADAPLRRRLSPT